jgi:CheY-like chemotaxis protein
VITDLRMPQMDGIELYRNLLSMRPELKDKVVFITGAVLDQETADFLDRVHAQAVPKPLEIPVLTETVRQTLLRQGRS